MEVRKITVYTTIGQPIYEKDRNDVTEINVDDSGEIRITY